MRNVHLDRREVLMQNASSCLLRLTSALAFTLAVTASAHAGSNCTADSNTRSGLPAAVVNVKQDGLGAAWTVTKREFQLGCVTKESSSNAIKVTTQMSKVYRQSLQYSNANENQNTDQKLIVEFTRAKAPGVKAQTITCNFGFKVRSGTSDYRSLARAVDCAGNALLSCQRQYKNSAAKWEYDITLAAGDL